MHPYRDDEITWTTNLKLIAFNHNLSNALFCAMRYPRVAVACARRALQLARELRNPALMYLANETLGVL